MSFASLHFERVLPSVARPGSPSMLRLAKRVHAHQVGSGSSSMSHWPGVQSRRACHGKDGNYSVAAAATFALCHDQPQRASLRMAGHS